MLHQTVEKVNCLIEGRLQQDQFLLPLILASNPHENTGIMFTPAVACVLLQEFTTNRYQVNLNGSPLTIVQTNNKTRNYALLANLQPTITYDVVLSNASHFIVFCVPSA